MFYFNLDITSAEAKLSGGAHLDGLFGSIPKFVMFLRFKKKGFKCEGKPHIGKLQEFSSNDAQVLLDDALLFYAIGV